MTSTCHIAWTLRCSKDVFVKNSFSSYTLSVERENFGDYRKISNTIRTLVQYAPQTFTRELWENVSLAVQYAPVLCHPSPSMASMPSAISTKRVSCSVTGAGKVTLIGSNCPASRVGRRVDCEGGGTAQIFSDCAITAKQ